jgi:hypothetical protein
MMPIPLWYGGRRAPSSTARSLGERPVEVDKEAEMAGDTQSKTKQVQVFVNRRKVDLESPLTGGQLLAQTGFEGQEWDLLLLQGEGDPTGGELILADRELTLKNGEHFRVIPGNRTFGS